MKKVIITATLTMTVFSAVPLVTPAQAFAASKLAQVHVVEEAPSTTAEQSLDFIEADAALATYNSGSLDTISDTQSLTTKSASSVPAKVKIWNKNGEDSTKRNSVSVRNLTVDQAVSLWMNEATRVAGKTLRSGDIMINGGRNYAIHLTDGTRNDLRNAMIKKLSQGLAGNAKKAAISVTNEILGYKKYGNSTKNEAGSLYNKKGIVVLRGISGERFDFTYWLTKCAIQCSQDMNLAQYENEDSARRDKDVSFAVMEWCRARAHYGYTSPKTTYRSLLDGHAQGLCESLADFVDSIASVYGVRMEVVGGDDHAINVLKTGGKYYYMDFQSKNDVICHIDSIGYGDSVSTPEYTQLLKEIYNMNLPQKADWDVVSERVANASPELLTLANTVVAQVEAKDPSLVQIEDGGEMKHWSACYNTALKYFIANYVYDYQNRLDIASRLYIDDIMNGRVGRGEANWQTFAEYSGKGSNYDYWNTPYGRITGIYAQDNNTVLGYKTQTKLLNNKQNRFAKNPAKEGCFSNVHVTGN